MLTQAQRAALMRPVTHRDIQSALLTIGDDKAPGIDGYTSKFFKGA